MLDSAPAPAKSATVPSAIPLIGQVDGRRRSFRRFKELMRAYGDEIGGFAGLSAAQAAALRNAAVLQLRAEQLEAAIVRGEPADGAELMRLISTSRRLLASLQAGARPAAA